MLHFGGIFFSISPDAVLGSVCLQQAGGNVTPPHGSVVAPVAQPKTGAESLKALQRSLVSTGGETALGLGSASWLVWVGLVDVWSLYQLFRETSGDGDLTTS